MFGTVPGTGVTVVQSFCSLSLEKMLVILCCGGVVLSIGECLAASLVSTHWMPETLLIVTTKYLNITE